MSTTDLSPHIDTIKYLATLTSKPSFKQEFDRRTDDLSNDVSFLIKMEAKRLAKSCIRSIDLRAKLKDECRLYTYNDIDHYLSANAIAEFERLIDEYGYYCFGVYEGILEFAKSEKQRYQSQQEELQSRQYTTEVDDNQYAVPGQALLKYPIRKEERLNYVTHIEVFFADNKSAFATTLDVSVHGLRIRLKDVTQVDNLEINQTVSVMFRDSDRAAGLHRDPVFFQVLGLNVNNGKASAHLYRNGTNENVRYERFVAELFRLHKRRYKVNLDNVEMAIGTKIYEQAFANNSPSLPVFIADTKRHGFVAKYTSINASTKPIIDYWTNEKKQLMLGYLFSNERMQSMIDDANKSSIIVYSFHHIKDEKIYFYSASHEELLLHPELADTFLSYASRKVSWRVFKLSCDDIPVGQGHAESSVPVGVDKEIDRQNKPLSPRLLGRISELVYMISITDITNDIAQECYQQRTLNKDNIKLLSQFGHPRNKPPFVMEAYRHKQTELRRQTRYVLRTPVLIKAPAYNIIAYTEDISVSGLKLELEEPYLERVNSKVKISFTKLRDITESYDLNNLQYHVKHISEDKQVLHLEAVSVNEASEAEQFFAELIANNSDKLPPITFEESVPGISHALRTLHARSTSQFCAYVEKKQQGFMPAMVSTNQLDKAWMEITHNDTNSSKIELSWLYQDDATEHAFVGHALKDLQIDPKLLNTELYVSVLDDGATGKQQVMTKWQYEIPTHQDKKAFMLNASQQGRFYALNITINKALKPDLEMLEHELLYLSQHAIHKATHFEERMWDLAGCIFVKDISDEVAARYRINSN